MHGKLETPFVCICRYASIVCYLWSYKLHQIGVECLVDLKKLEQTHSDVFIEFIDDNCVVKRTDINFNQVSTDQALHHIACVRDSPNGTIGNFTNSTIGSQWYHWYPENHDRISAANGTIGANITIGENVGTNGTIGTTNGTIGKPNGVNSIIMINISN